MQPVSDSVERLLTELDFARLRKLNAAQPNPGLAALLANADVLELNAHVRTQHAQSGIVIGCERAAADPERARIVVAVRRLCAAGVLFGAHVHDLEVRAATREQARTSVAL